MDSQVADTNQERNSSDLSHLDNGEGNSPATGQIQVLGPESGGALAVRAAFAPVREMAEGWLVKARAINVASIEQVEEMTLARESRIGLSKVSGAIDRWHKEHKADALARGREIDDIARDLKSIVTAARDACRHQEEFAKRHEEARLAALRADRHALLIQHGANPGDYTDLATVSEDGWNALFAKVVRAAELEAAAKAEAARLEAARVAEEERLAAEAREAARAEQARQDTERLERERLQAEENARLKAEAVEREKVVEAERAERARQDAIREEALRIEREAAAEIARVVAEKARVEREAVEAEARRVRAELERVERARAAEREAAEARRIAEVRALREREEAEEKARHEAAAAPDREKLLAYAEALAAVPQPVLATTAGLSALGKIVEQVLKLVAGIRRLAGGL